MKKRKLIVFGTAEIASLARYYFENDSDYSVLAFTADDSHVKEDSFETLPVIPFSEITSKFSQDDVELHVALSYKGLNNLRMQKYNQCKDAGFKIASYVCSKSVTWPDLKHGDNCFILENQTIQPTVTLGNNVMLWSGNHIGHGTYIGDHTYLSSHVVLSGHCQVGERCFFGVNSTVKDFTSIGNDCFIAMGASVTKDLQNGSSCLGAQSTILAAEDRTAIALKRKYFGLQT